MIILNVNEINEIDSRRNFSKECIPEEYNSEEELIEWLQYDLYLQAINNLKNPDKNNIITIYEEEEKYYRLSIYSNSDVKINFEFNILHIVSNLKKTKNFINSQEINFELSFCHVIFTKGLNLDYLTFNNELYFLGCTFEQTLSLKKSHLKENFKLQLNIFEKGINCSEALIYKQLLLIKSGRLSIAVHDIYDKIRLKNSYISEPLNSIIIFDNLKFNDINSKLYIDGLTYRKNRELSFQDININGVIELRNMKVKELDFKGSFINGGVVNPINFQVQKFSNRESALFLKQQAIANHNYIDALQYQAEEVRLHKEELFQKWSEDKLKIKTVGDIISINLSSLFSDNGVNWIKALGMTILSTLVLFTIFYFPDLPTIMRMIYRNDYSLLYYYFSKDFFEDFIRYIIPTEYDLVFNYAKNYTSTNFFKFVIKIFGVITYFTGKIAFWYGSFHTVSAFRKFNRSL